MHNTYSDPHNLEYGWVGNEWLPIGYSKPKTDSLPFNPDQMPPGKFDPTPPKPSQGYMQVTGNLMNDSNQQIYPDTHVYHGMVPNPNNKNQEIYKAPEIDYAKLVDELLKRIRKDAGYRYELPGYPKEHNYEYCYRPDQTTAAPNTYWYNNPVTSQASSPSEFRETGNIYYTKGNDPRDSAYSEWML